MKKKEEEDIRQAKKEEKRIKKQIETARKLAEENQTNNAGESGKAFQREEGDKKVEFKMQPKLVKSGISKKTNISRKEEGKEAGKEELGGEEEWGINKEEKKKYLGRGEKRLFPSSNNPNITTTTISKKSKLSPLEELKLKVQMEEERKNQRGNPNHISLNNNKEKNNRKDVDVDDDFEEEENWLKEGLYVKIMHKKLAGGKYYKKKGIVRKMRGRYAGEIEILDSKDRLKLDQKYLETVIPAKGKQVEIVLGKYKNKPAVLKDIDLDNFYAIVQVKMNNGDRKEVKLDYSEVCKV